jgi:hypothetical protein
VLVNAAHHQNTAATLSYLNQIAEQARLDFVLEGAPVSVPVAVGAGELAAQERTPVSVVLRHILESQPPPPRWGINE